MLDKPPWAIDRPTLTAAALLLFAYTVTAVACLQFATVKGAGAAVWVPAGVGIAGLFLGGIRLWPTILLARLAAGALTGSEQPWWAELAIATGNALSSVLGVWLVQRRSAMPAFGELPGMLRFIVAAGLLPAALAGVVGTATLYLSSGVSASDLSGIYLRWAAGNAAAALVVVPFILSLREPLPAGSRRAFWLLLVVTALSSALIFLEPEGGILRTWHVYPFLIWAALAFSIRGAATALMILEAMAVSGVLLGHGPIVNIDNDPNWALIHLHQFLVFTSTTILVLTAVSDERRGKAALARAQAELRELNAQLAARVQERTAELHKTEEALFQARKMEAIGQLTGGVAHDFNNLLQTISGSLELISRQPGSPNLRRWVHTAQRATASGTRLTRQLLAFSRLQQLELRPVDLAAHIGAMAEVLRSALGSQVQLAFALEPARGLHVLADRTQLEMMILNLTVNARDAMPDGGHLTIGAQPESIQGDPNLAPGPYVRIYVQDTGSGMPPEVIARAFDPFFTTKGVGKGTGLGLSMVYGVARQSGGMASIDSHPDRGTTVSILLPCVAPEGAVPSAASGAVSHEHLPPLNVMLVDDDEAVRETTSSLLQELGMRVQQAGSGPEAMALAIQPGAVRPDLIMMDYSMPQMNGVEVARRLRQDGVTAPILMITGNADLEQVREQLGSGGSLLQKPFQLAELETAIRACTNTASTRGSAAGRRQTSL